MRLSSEIKSLGLTFIGRGRVWEVGRVLKCPRGMSIFFECWAVCVWG